MPFAVTRLAALRPWLYHLTAVANVPRVRRLRQLLPAADLIRAAGDRRWLAERRADRVPVVVAGETVVLRDQRPLDGGRITFEAGWDLPRLVAHLNARVFFWPGDDTGPIESGRRHFAAYANAAEAVLRVPTAALLASNPDPGPLFCRYNSGAPGRFKHLSPRGSTTFLPADRFPGAAGGVKEVTFAAAVALPAETEVGDVTLARWRPLFAGREG